MEMFQATSPTSNRNNVPAQEKLLNANTTSNSSSFDDHLQQAQSESNTPQTEDQSEKNHIFINNNNTVHQEKDSEQTNSKKQQEIFDLIAYVPGSAAAAEDVRKAENPLSQSLREQTPVEDQSGRLQELTKVTGEPLLDVPRSKKSLDELKQLAIQKLAQEEITGVKTTQVKELPEEKIKFFTQETVNPIAKQLEKIQEKQIQEILPSSTTPSLKEIQRSKYDQIKDFFSFKNIQKQDGQVPIQTKANFSSGENLSYQQQGSMFNPYFRVAQNQDSLEAIPFTESNNTAGVNLSPFKTSSTQLTKEITETQVFERHQTIDIDEVLGRVKMMLSNDRNQLVMKLNPEHLGKLEFHLNKQGEQLKAQIIVESILAKETLENQLQKLHKGLEDQGLQIHRSNIEVIVNEKNQDNFGASFSKQDQKGNQFHTSQLNKGSIQEEKENEMPINNYQDKVSNNAVNIYI